MYHAGKMRGRALTRTDWRDNPKGNLPLPLSLFLSSNSLIPLAGRPLWRTLELNFRSYGIRGILRRSAGPSVIRSAIIPRSAETTSSPLRDGLCTRVALCTLPAGKWANK